ncbi:hypothetical protein UMM65_04520 [Aureibaculum sp. 2210JD6-5]|uniref:hypothetical protein n=1 Tax=Aureibaculum sp. 2210JD6-5 TaxID=3103957 RepID=UPI002AACDE24|nr:hypothetical protein [Aureibaculum sp. 2210JD6-5]MDY7394494.1 hypothetical protein [Aureibaculum sp. 2210JD6-5]
MSTVFKKRQSSFLIKLLLFALALFAVHSYLVHYFVSEDFFFPLWQIYVFHCFVTFLVYAVVNYKYSQGKTEIFIIFMGSTLLKMIVAILFLLPLLLSDFENKKPDIFNFFILYFCFLAFEVYFITSLLKEK